MNLFVLYLVMLKATLTTFSGPMSLPLLRNDLVTHRHVLSDYELTTAVTAAQASPGPMGIYVVGVGYFVAGVPGAIAGMLALLTPAILSVPLSWIMGRWVDNDRVRRAMDAAVLASAGLIATSAVPLAQASFQTPLHYLLAAAAFVAAIKTGIPTALLLLMAGAVGVVASLLH